jgi:trigger factor
MTDANERLNSSVRDLGPSRKEIEATIPAEEASREYERALETYARRAKLKGFRPGTAPKPMVKRMFDPDIRQAVLDELIPRTLDDVLTARSIMTVGTPTIGDVSFEEGQPLRFKAVVEVWPEFSLSDYARIKVKKRAAAVSEEDVAKAMDDLRKKAAEYIPVEGRGVRDGDYVVIELQGRDVKTKRLLPAKKAMVVAGLESNDPAVNEHLSGMTPGEEKTFVHAYPADFPGRKLAGRDISYTLKVLSMKEMRLPEANDDFAKTVGDYDTLAGLKAKIEAELKAAKEQSVRRETSDDIVRDILDRTAIDLPPGVLDHEAEHVLNEMLESLRGRRLTQEAFTALQAASRKQAEFNLKRQLVLRKIAQAEGFKILEEDADAEIRAWAEANRIPPAEAMESFRQEGRRESLKTSLLLKKTIDFLTAQAIIE